MKLFKKMIKADKPINVLVGTCAGSKQDTEALARSQVERYFDIPGNSWMLIRPLNDSFIYEIHEGGSGKPYLPNILKAMKGEEGSVFLQTLSGKAIQIVRRENGALATIMLPAKAERSINDIEVDADLTGSMKPYATTGAEWNRIGFASLSLGVLMMTIAGVVSKSFDIAMQGYLEVASTLPISRIAELTVKPETPSDIVKPLEALPVSQWNELFEAQLGYGESISRLVYQQGQWEVQRVRPGQDGASLEIESRHPLEVQSNTDINLPPIPPLTEVNP